MKKISFKEAGKEAPAKYFTGTVHVNMIVGEDDDFSTSMGMVTFEKGARTNWHIHTTGQILIVTEGIGCYQERGKAVEEIKEGEVIKIPVNVEHWHGASNESAVRHIAFVPNEDTGKKGVTDWLEAVSDRDYNS
ncbi:MAG: cupin domain-containing protein [Parafilimonas sp.]